MCQFVPSDLLELQKARPVLLAGGSDVLSVDVIRIRIGCNSEHVNRCSCQQCVCIHSQNIDMLQSTLYKQHLGHYFTTTTTFFLTFKLYVPSPSNPYTMAVTKSFFMIAVLALVLSAQCAPTPQGSAGLTRPITVSIPSGASTLHVTSRKSVSDAANNFVNEVKRITHLSTPIIIAIAVGAAVLLLLLILCCCCCCCSLCK